MATEQITIRVDETGARVVSRRIGDVGRSAREAGGGVSFLHRALGLLGGALLVREVYGMVNSFQELTNKVNAVSATAGIAEATFQRLRASANDTRVPIESTAAAYQKFRIATRQMGTSTADVIKLVDLMQKSLISGGATTQEAATVALQYGQALGKGKLDGEEFKAVAEASALTLQLLADQMGVGVGELKDLAAQGKITGDVMVNTFLNQEEAIRELFSKSMPTLTQSMTVLRNEAMVFFGELANGTGIGQAFSEAILYIARNMDTFARAIVGAGLALGITFARDGVNKAIAALVRLQVVLAANPFYLLAAAVGIVLGFLIAFSDKIKLAGDDTRTLADLFRALGAAIIATAKAIIGIVDSLLRPIINVIKDIFNVTSVGFTDTARVVVFSVQLIVNILRVLTAALKLTFLGPIALIGEVMIEFFRVMFGWIDDLVNGAINAANAITRAMPDFYLDENGDVQAGARQKLFDNVDFEIDFANPLRGSVDSLAGDFVDALKNVDQTDIIDAFEGSLEKIKETKEAVDDLNDAGPPAPKPPDTSGLDKMIKALRSLRDELDPIGAAQRTLADTATLLNSAYAAGLVTQEEAIELLKQKKDAMRGQLEPLAETLDQLRQEREQVGLSSEARRIAARVRQEELDLMEKGVKITGDVHEQIKESVSLIYAEADALAAREKAEREASQALQKQLADDERFLEDYRQRWAEINAMEPDPGPIRAYFNELAEGARTLNTQLEELVVSGFGDLENILSTGLVDLSDAFYEAARSGELSFTTMFENIGEGFHKMAQAIMKQLAQLLVRMLIFKTLSGFLGGGGLPNVSNPDILEPTFAAKGGTWTVGGSAGTDTNLAAFALSRGEQVQVKSVDQLRQERQDAAAGGGANAQGEVHVIAVRDNGAELEAALMGNLGKRVIVHHLSDDPDLFSTYTR